MVKEFKYEYVTYDELYQAYLDCRCRKRGTANELKFEINENIKLYNLWVDLNTQKYVIGRSICFMVEKPVPREVFAADFRDRIVHHLFINRILKFVEDEFIEDTYSCRVGKGTQYGVQKCYDYVKECSENYTKDSYILKCDLKSFFVTINKDILYNLISIFLEEKCGYTGKDLKFMCWLLKLIIYNVPTVNCIIKGFLSDWDKLPKEKSLFYALLHKGLPIGNLTSQIFANLYLSAFDHFVKEKLGFKYYGRYVDDFFIVDNDKKRLINAIPIIREELKKIEVTLHPKKVYLQHYTKGVKFIGHVVKPNRIYIGNRTKGNFYETINKESKIFKKETVSKNELEHFVSSINSYLGFMKNYTTFNIRKKMLKSSEFSPFYKVGTVNASHARIKVTAKKDEYAMCG